MSTQIRRAISVFVIVEYLVVLLFALFIKGFWWPLSWVLLGVLVVTVLTIYGPSVLKRFMAWRLKSAKDQGFLFVKIVRKEIDDFTKLEWSDLSKQAHVEVEQAALLLHKATNMAQAHAADRLTAKAKEHIGHAATQRSMRLLSEAYEAEDESG